MADLAAVESACGEPVALIWAETPSNPRLKVCDIAALARIAHAHGALLACDNTFATPVLQRPLLLGADVVMHSTTNISAGTAMCSVAPWCSRGATGFSSRSRIAATSPAGCCRRSAHG